MGINVGKVDRSIRFIIGAALVVLGASGVLSGPLAVIGYVVAAIALLTGMLRICPLWSLCRVNTAK